MAKALIVLIGSFALAGIGIILLALYFSVPSYTIDYSGEKASYRRARSRCRSGKQVHLYYTLTATDTTYRFLLDGKEISYRYDDKLGLEVSFKMPPHDVRLECHSKNISAIEKGSN